MSGPRLPVALTLLTCLLATPAGAQAPLIDTFGGTLGFGTGGVLPGNDDGSSARISLTSAFPGGLRFFGGTYNDFYVNNNGNITFNGTLRTYTPSTFGTGAVTAPMIAPYWGDVDTRGGGSPNENYVAWHLAPGLLAVTWHNVGYYDTLDDRKMDFQMILRNALDCGSGNFDVEFRYNRCEWMAGGASGDSNENGQCDPSESTCVPALAGFDAANPARDYVSIEYSRTTDVLRLCTESNVGMPGVWRFAVRDGTVICPDAGEPCETGGTGACSLGLTACIGGSVECVAVGTSSSESCDNIDNDCNGSVDDGDGLCPPGEVCVTGACVPPCFEGACGEGETCDATGGCVETACIGVTCGPGQRCAGGTCVDGCGGIVCPHGQQCFAGRCADLCDILECADSEICVDGECVPECPCRPCEADEICGADGSCTPIGCDITICDPGFYCDGGACLDACDGAVCPAGQRCELGSCVSIPVMPDAGSPGGDDVGIGGDDTGNGEPLDGGEADGGRRPRTPRSCGCSAPTRDGALGWSAIGLGLLLVAARRRSWTGKAR